MGIRQKAFLILIFLMSAPGSPGTAQEPVASPISVTAEVDPARATLGDLVTYTVRVRHDPDIQVSAPEFAPVEGLEKVDEGRGPSQETEGKIHREFWGKYRADRVGRLTFPALEIPFKKRGPEKEWVPGTLQTREVPLEVQSVLRLQGEPTDVRGIKPIEPVGGDGWRYLLWTLAALAAAAGGVWLWKNRRRGAVLSSEPPPPPAPHERALRDLETLQSRRLMTQGQIREHYFLLSEIFRRYLGDRYGFPALDWTREEIVAQLERVTPLSPDLRQRVGDILQRTDQVKFARAQVDPADDGIQDIVRFIEITRPREEASAAPTERVQVS